MSWRRDVSTTGNEVVSAIALLQRNDLESVAPERCPGGPQLTSQRGDRGWLALAPDFCSGMTRLGRDASDVAIFSALSSYQIMVSRRRWSPPGASRPRRPSVPAPAATFDHWRHPGGWARPLVGQRESPRRLGDPARRWR